MLLHHTQGRFRKNIIDCRRFIRDTETIMKDAPEQMQQFATAEKAYRLTGAASANLIRQWAARGLIETYRWHDSKVYRLSEIRKVMEQRGR